MGQGHFPWARRSSMDRDIFHDHKHFLWARTPSMASNIFHEQEHLAWAGTPAPKRVCSNKEAEKMNKVGKR